nr:MAG TPA: hypothetical protein [Bacteriophage sp.]
MGAMRRREPVRIAPLFCSYRKELTWTRTRGPRPRPTT